MHIPIHEKRARFQYLAVEQRVLFQCLACEKRGEADLSRGREGSMPGRCCDRHRCCRPCAFYLPSAA